MFKWFIWMVIGRKSSRKPHLEHLVLYSISQSFAFLFNSANVDHTPLRRGSMCQWLKAPLHSGVRMPRFASWFYFLCLWSWTNSLTSLCLSIFLCKRSMIIVLTFQEFLYYMSWNGKQNSENTSEYIVTARHYGKREKCLIRYAHKSSNVSWRGISGGSTKGMRIKKAKVNFGWGRVTNEIWQCFLEMVCFDLSIWQWRGIKAFRGQRASRLSKLRVIHSVITQNNTS